MSRIRHARFHTACGLVRHVSLKTFVSQVENLEWAHEYVMVDIRNENEPGCPFPNWERKHFFFDKKPILEQIVLQLGKEQLTYKGLDTIHDAICLLVVEMGCPEMMVRISRRQWMIANPADFRVFSRNGTLVIVCIHPKRNLLINLSRDISN